MNITLEYVVSECVRQQTGPAQVGYMLNAVNYARNSSTRPRQSDAARIAFLVEPDVNMMEYNLSDKVWEHNYRRTPVTFRDCSLACHWQNIPAAMDRLFEYLPDIALDLVDDWCKALLDIHPWADGNGRTVSVLRNWILNTLDNPTPLPYYYGDT